MTSAVTLVRFVGQLLGRAGIGTNPTNAGQCVGLVERWLSVSGRRPVSGNAVDLLANAPKAALRVMYNTPTNSPAPGDIVCWDGSWGNGYGHCAIVIAATETQLAVFEQNDPVGSPPIVATHDYTGVAGWIWW